MAEEGGRERGREERRRGKRERDELLHTSGVRSSKQTLLKERRLDGKLRAWRKT